MEPITCKKVNVEIVKHYAYLRTLDLSFGWRIHRFWLWFYSVTIVSVVLLYVTTDSNTLIVLKVMSLVTLFLMFLIGLGVLTRDSIRKSRHSKKAQILLDSALNSEYNYSIQFNEKTIIFITDKVKTEIEWSYWEGYREVDGMLFLFIKDHLYGTTSFSTAEIGTEHFESIRAIIKKELPELDESKLRKWYQLR